MKKFTRLSPLFVAFSVVLTALAQTARAQTFFTRVAGRPVNGPRIVSVGAAAAFNGVSAVPTLVPLTTLASATVLTLTRVAPSATPTLSALTVAALPQNIEAVTPMPTIPAPGAVATQRTTLTGLESGAARLAQAGRDGASATTGQGISKTMFDNAAEKDGSPETSPVDGRAPESSAIPELKIKWQTPYYLRFVDKAPLLQALDNRTKARIIQQAVRENFVSLERLRARDDSWFAVAGVKKAEGAILYTVYLMNSYYGVASFYRHAFSLKLDANTGEIAADFGPVWTPHSTRNASN